MPELPEVETVARGLKHLQGQCLESLEIIDPKVWFESVADPECLRGLRVREVSRRGKYLLYRFENGFTLVQHLRMTGKVLEADSPLVPSEVRRVVDTRAGKALQVRCRFRFESGELWFFDTRRFGTLTLVENEQHFFHAKGIAPDPIQDPSPALAWFLERLPRSKRPIKNALLDQNLVAGVGNIYADEALHAVGIHPRLPAHRVRDSLELWKEIQRILAEALRVGGSTVRDYVSATGEKGAFVQQHRVYDRTGKECRSCRRAKIRRIVLGGRSTHYCPECQPLRQTKPKLREKTGRSTALRQHRKGVIRPRR